MFQIFKFRPAPLLTKEGYGTLPGGGYRLLDFNFKLKVANLKLLTAPLLTKEGYGTLPGGGSSTQFPKAPLLTKEGCGF